MKITRSDQLAQQTLTALRAKIAKVTPGHAHITPYEGSREMGLVLHVAGYPTSKSNDFMDFAWTFSEAASSDYVVVYTGDLVKAQNLRRNYPRIKKYAEALEKIYHGAAFFKTPKEAAAFIARCVKNAVAKAVFNARKAS